MEREKPEPKPQVVKAPFPMGGLNTVLSAYRRDLTTSQDLRNVRGVEPTTDRKRGSKRGGLTREFDGAVSAWVQHINHMVLAIGDDVAVVSGQTFDGEDKWQFPLLAGNGSIYSMPASQPSIGAAHGLFKVDPSTESGEVLGAAQFAGINLYRPFANAVEAGNGCIYAHMSSLGPSSVPGNSDFYPYAFLKLDTATDIITFLTWSLTAITDGYFRPRVAVIAPNDCIYIFGGNAYVVKIDTATGTVSTFGTVDTEASEDMFVSAVLVGTDIYGIPYSGQSVLKIDTATDTLSTFGSFAAGGSKWKHGVLADNGKIYGIPYGSAQVLEIDPNTDSTATFGSLGDEATFPGIADQKYWHKWNWGVLADSGKIYCVPAGFDAVLKIDPDLSATSTFGSLVPDDDYTAATRWFMGVLASSGKIYCPPALSRSVLRIDPDVDEVTLMGSYADPDVGTHLFLHAVRAGSKIFAIPYDSTYILRLV